MYKYLIVYHEALAQDTVKLWTSGHPLAQPVTYDKNFIPLCSGRYLPGFHWTYWTFAGPADRKVRLMTTPIHHKMNL